MIQEHIPDVYHLSFGPHEPIHTLQPNQPLRVHVPDCDGYDAAGNVLPRHRFAQYDDYDIMVGNPVAGPYALPDAQPGDSIVVHIDDITIDRDFGRTGLSARQSHIPAGLFRTAQDSDLNVVLPREIRRWHIDREKQIARLALENSACKSVEVPLAPFVGCIAVAPENGQVIHTLHVGNFGGNIDVPGLGAGAKVYLPVFAKGARLFLGDLHAAQGDGEIIGGAIEVGGAITFRVTLRRNQPLAAPRVETDHYIGAIGTGGNLQQALEQAYAQLILWLSEDYGFDRWDAFHLVSQVVRAAPGNFRSACCRIDKQFLPPRTTD